MTVDPIVLATIISMSVVTYATRVAGFALMSKAAQTGRLAAWLSYIPGAVLVAIVAPAVFPMGLNAEPRGESGALTGGMPEAVAAIVTAIVAVRLKNLLFAMVAGVATVWLLRRLMGG